MALLPIAACYAKYAHLGGFWQAVERQKMAEFRHLRAIFSSA
jgi:hypothetical protein